MCFIISGFCNILGYAVENKHGCSILVREINKCLLFKMICKWQVVKFEKKFSFQLIFIIRLINNQTIKFNKQ